MRARAMPVELRDRRTSRSFRRRWAAGELRALVLLVLERLDPVLARWRDGARGTAAESPTPDGSARPVCTVLGARAWRTSRAGEPARRPRVGAGGGAAGRVGRGGPAPREAAAAPVRPAACSTSRSSADPPRGRGSCSASRSSGRPARPGWPLARSCPAADSGRPEGRRADRRGRRRRHARAGRGRGRRRRDPGHGAHLHAAERGGAGGRRRRGRHRARRAAPGGGGRAGPRRLRHPGRPRRAVRPAPGLAGRAGGRPDRATGSVCRSSSSTTSTRPPSPSGGSAPRAARRRWCSSRSAPGSGRPC